MYYDRVPALLFYYSDNWYINISISLIILGVPYLYSRVVDEKEKWTSTSKPKGDFLPTLSDIHYF